MRFDKRGIGTRKKAKTIVIMAAVFALFLLLVNTTSAGSLNVPDSLKVSKAFDKPKDTTPSFTSSTSFTIRNNANKTVAYSISDITTEPGLTIKPSPSSGKIAPYGSAYVSLTIALSSSLSEGEHTGRVRVSGDGESHTILIRISITQKAKLVVSPTSVTFDTIGPSGSSSKSVTFSETLGYKTVKVSLKRTSGKGWVTASSNSFDVGAGSAKPITFSLKPSGITSDKCVRHHSWKYSVSSTEGAGSSTINLKGEICCPAKLSYDHRTHTTLRFNEPKSEHHTFHTMARIKVSNTGCERMQLKSPRVSSPSGGVSISLKNYPSYVDGYSSDYIDLDVSAPYDTPERTYTGSVSIDAGSAGSGTAEVQVSIQYGVDLEVTPRIIAFGDVEILKEASRTVTLKEKFGYKSAKNIKISKKSGPNWISVQPSSMYGIPASGSDSVKFVLTFEGDAILGMKYDWVYEVSSDADRDTISLSARAMHVNNEELLNELEGMRNTGLYSKYQSKTENIISSGVDMKSAAKSDKTLTTEDWGHLELVLMQSLSLLKSLNDVTEHLDKNDHDTAFEKIIVALRSSKSIGGHSKMIAGSTVSTYAKKVSTAADGLVSNMLADETSYYKDRAEEMNETNYLEAFKACRNVATVYGLTQESSKEDDFNSKADVLLELHDDEVENANKDRVEAEKIALDMKENELTRIGGGYALFNPFNYDVVAKGYGQAIETYEGTIASYNKAGEIRMSEDAAKYLAELKGEWTFMRIGFYVFMLILIAILVFVLFRSVKGMLAYITDSNEERLGNVVIGEY